MSNSAFIHPTAIIDENVSIGDDTRIWHFSHIMSGARIGQGCTLGQNVFIGADVSIGSRVKIQNNVSVYTGVELADEVFVGPSAVFTNVMNPRSAVERKDEFRKTKVGRGATIGANATIVCGIELGEYCFIGAGAVVTKPVPPYALVTGNPAAQTGWMSKTGSKLEFDGDGIAKCETEGAEYRLVNGKVERREK